MKKRLSIIVCSLVILLTNSGCSSKVFERTVDSSSYEDSKSSVEKIYFGVSVPEVLNIFRAKLIKEYGDDITFYPYRDKLIARYSQIYFSDNSFPEVSEFNWIIDAKSINDTVVINVSSSRQTSAGEEVYYLPKERFSKLLESIDFEIDKFASNNVQVIERGDFEKNDNVVFSNKIATVSKASSDDVLSFSENLIDFSEFDKISLENNTIDKEKLLPVISNGDTKYPDLPTADNSNKVLK